MSVYKKVYRSLCGLTDKLNIMRIRYGEKSFIKSKKKFYEDFKWTDEQKTKFEKFWLENYGEKIPDWWHKMYHNISGVYHEDYIPGMIFTTVIEPELNPLTYSKVFSNKALQYNLYSGTDGIYIPKAYIFNNGGRFSDGEYNILTRAQAEEALKNCGKVVIKTTVGSSGGKSIHVADIENGVDKKTGKKVGEILDDYSENYLVQE